MTIQPNEEEAIQIWKILVEHCGLFDEEVEMNRFMWVQSKDKICREFRFQGKLGFGGKFRVRPDSWYVDCYQEDETAEILEAIKAANMALAQLLANRHLN